MAGAEPLTISDKDRVHAREHFTVAQMTKLLDTVQQGPSRFGLTSLERALLYRFAVETGLRANEIRVLKVRSLELPEDDLCIVRLKGGETKNKERNTIPLNPELVTELRRFVVGRSPDDRLFQGDTEDGSLTPQTAKMLKKDLKAAEIPYTDDGKFHDFHALRHTTSQWLTNMGVHPRIIQWVMRHKVMKMEDQYTKEDLALMAAATRRLASYGRRDQAGSQQQAGAESQEEQEVDVCDAA